MSLRFRRSMKIAPGIRLNFNKNSIGISAGVPGARASVNSKGDIYTSAGIPGTGLYSVERSSARQRSGASGTRTRKPKEPTQFELEEQLSDLPPGQPGIFAKKDEREFYFFIRRIYDHTGHQESPEEIITIGNEVIAQFPTLELPIKAMQFLHGVTDTTTVERAVQIGDEIWPKRAELFSHKLVAKYFTGLTPQVPITAGITSIRHYDHDCFAFTYAEMLQNGGRLEEALAVVEEANPSQMAAISIADIELAMKRYDDVLQTTDDIENIDDATAMLLIFRAIAFREKKLFDASLETLKLALAKKDRSEEVINRALWERHLSNLADGKKAAAIKDLQKILTNESTYEGVQEALDKLQKAGEK